MAREPVISRIKKKRILQLISQGKRVDGRGLLDYREITVEKGVIRTAEGSAMVCLGQTEVVVGIKVGLNTPYPDTPNEGILTVNAELVPLASPTFEPGPPDERAIELARVVDRGIRSSRAIPLDRLCIVPGKRVYIVFVDIYILNHDGNLVDASALEEAATPWLLTAFAVSALVAFAQVGPLFAPKAIAPKLDRLSPANGVERLFSKRNLFGVLLGAVGAVLVGVTCISMLLGALNAAAGGPWAGYRAMAAVAESTASKMMLGAGLVLTALGALDYLIARKEHRRDLFMTPEEAKREHREQEGDPSIKARRRELHMEMAAALGFAGIP